MMFLNSLVNIIISSIILVVVITNGNSAKCAA